MHSASVGDPAQLAWHCCCCGGASHRATQASFVQTPGSRLPFFKLTMAATWTSLGVPSESFMPRRKFTYAATGSREAMLPSIAAASAAHLSITLPCGSLTSIDMRCDGSEQSSASVTKATTILAPSRTNPLVVSGRRPVVVGGGGGLLPLLPLGLARAGRSSLDVLAEPLAELRRGRVLAP